MSDVLACLALTCAPSSLRLRARDVEIIKAVAAVVVAWYNGTEGGNALADVLFGKVDAGGRLPYAIPADEAHLPFFERETKEIVYDG